MNQQYLDLLKRTSVVQTKTSTWEICHTPAADMQCQYNTRKESQVRESTSSGFVYVWNKYTLKFREMRDLLGKEVKKASDEQND